MTYDPYDGMTRREYLQGLAEDFGLDRSVVFSLASMLGPSEDFDGLINALEDAEAQGL